MSEPRTRPTGNPLWATFTRAAVGYTVLTVYASLLPLNFTDPGPAIGATLARFPFLVRGFGAPSDWVSNVLLFVPLGFLWSAVLLNRGSERRRRAVSWGIVAAAAGLSAGIEFVQFWVPARTVSQFDVLAEALGAGIGVAGWWRFGPPLTVWLAGRLKATPSERFWDALLQAYAVVLALLLLFPMDPTIRPTELLERYRGGKIILDPFAAPFGQRLAWAGWQVPLFVPVGILLATGFTRPSAPVRGYRACWDGAVLVAVGLFCGQVMIVGRTADVLDVPAWLLGMMAGAAWVHRAVVSPVRSVYRARWRPAMTGDRLLLGYFLAILFAAVWLVWATHTSKPGSRAWTGWSLPDWDPPAWVSLYGLGCLGLLTLVPRWPVAAVMAYTVAAYGLLPRFHPAADALRAIGLLEVLSLLACVGVWLGPAGRQARLRLHWLEVLLLAQLAWTIFSATAALLSGRPWIPEATQQCFRMAEASAMMLIAARTMTSGASGRAWCAVLGLGLVARALVFPEMMYLDHVTAMLAAIALPLVAYCLVETPGVSWRIGLGLAWLKLVSVLNAGQSRSALGGAAAGLLAWGLLSRYRLWLLPLAALAVLAVLALAAGTPLGERLRDLWKGSEGWDTGRLELWEIGWQAFRAHPVLGIGPGARPAGELDAHNSYVAVLSETGAVGLALYLAFWIGAAVVLGRVILASRRWPGEAARAAAAATAAYLVTGLGYSLHGLVLAYVIAGWAVALDRQVRTEP